MTKMVRIENADTGRDKRVRIEVWQEGTPSPSFVYDLEHPTAMREVCVYSGAYLVIREENIEKEQA